MPKIISRAEAIEQRLTKYFTGKPCPQGHKDFRIVSNRSCKKCSRNNSDAWLQKNKSSINERKLIKYHENKEEINAKKRELRAIKRAKKKIPKFKICTSCKKKLKKTSKNFRTKKGTTGNIILRQPCRVCERIQVSEYSKTEKGKEVKRNADKKYRKSGGKAISDKKYRDKNKDKLIKAQVDRRNYLRKTNPVVKLRDNISLRIRLALKEINLSKRNTTKIYTGCEIPFLKDYIQSKFTSKMSWDNYGRFGWHIDHIVPISYFIENYNFESIEIQKICFNFRNLQPLWEKDNIIKSNKISKEEAEKKIAEIKKLII